MVSNILDKNSELSLGVYIGSNFGNNSECERSVILLGEGLVSCGYTLVYGGASIGLMGLLAKTVKNFGGKVTGVITKHLVNKEILFTEADKLLIVDSMYERKRLIHEKSSRFLIMPGGLGTFDEFMETWCQIKIGIINKKIGVANIHGYFDGLFHFINHAKSQGFLTENDLKIPKFYSNIEDFLNDLSDLNDKESKAEDFQIESKIFEEVL